MAYSIIDIKSVLSESSNPRDYWFNMKKDVITDDGFDCRQSVYS